MFTDIIHNLLNCTNILYVVMYEPQTVHCLSLCSCSPAFSLSQCLVACLSNNIRDSVVNVSLWCILCDGTACHFFFFRFGLYLRSDKELVRCIIRLNETKSQFPRFVSFHYISPHKISREHSADAERLE